jgi:hypothetical protein
MCRICIDGPRPAPITLGDFHAMLASLLRGFGNELATVICLRNRRTNPAHAALLAIATGSELGLA